jgi:hypothetical protein
VLKPSFGLTRFIAVIGKDFNAAHFHAIFKRTAFPQAAIGIDPAGGDDASWRLQRCIDQALTDGIQSLLSAKGRL